MPHGGCMFRLRFRAAMIFELAPSDRFRMMKKTQRCARRPSRSLASLLLHLKDMREFRVFVNREES